MFAIEKKRAATVGKCLHCGAGARGPVSVYEFKIGTFVVRLCLNCLKTLRLNIQTVLGDNSAS